MIGATADTNVYVSALVFGGTPRQLLMHAVRGRFELAISPALLDELEGVLRDKFKWSIDQIEEVRSLLDRCTTLVHPTLALDVVPADPDDNRVIECAVTASSQIIVTGDSDLLRLGTYADIRMLTVAEFLQVLNQSSS